VCLLELVNQLHELVVSPFDQRVLGEGIPESVRLRTKLTSEMNQDSAGLGWQAVDVPKSKMGQRYTKVADEMAFGDVRLGPRLSLGGVRLSLAVLLEYCRERLRLGVWCARTPVELIEREEELLKADVPPKRPKRLLDCGRRTGVRADGEPPSAFSKSSGIFPVSIPTDAAG
jgi:hypothetical protein